MNYNPRIAAFLQQAMQAQRGGDLAGAEAACREALKIDARNPDALQFLGLVCRHSGRLGEGEKLMRLSLEINPAQPHTWNNLGSLLDHQARPDEAADCYAEAVRLDPKHADAWVNLGTVLSNLEKYADAEKALKTALSLQPSHGRALITLGINYRQTNQFDQAEDCYRKALDIQPDNFHALYNLGVTLDLADKCEEAVGQFRKALDVNPAMPEAHFSLGRAKHRLGATDRAIQHLEKAIDLRPDYTECHETLNKILWQHDRRDEFLSSYPPAIKRAPEAVPLRLKYADGLLLSADSASAEKVLQQAVSEIGPLPELSHALAKAQWDQGKTDAARRQFEAAIKERPDSTRYRYDFARVLIAADEFEQALSHLEAAEKLQPFNQEGWAYKGLCWRLMGDEREAWLNDYDRFIRGFKIPVPEGYEDLESFNLALNKALDPFHDTTVHPLDQTLRGGTQTWEHIFDSKVLEIQQLRKSVEATIERYLETLAFEADHPLLCRLGNGFKFRGSWSVRLKSEGFHVNHVHSEGWVSACYYVAVPDVVSQTSDHQGWIKFGQSSLELGEREVIKKMIQPEPGLLALFPSYTYHGTMPFTSKQARTTLPFDIIPGA